MRHRYIVAVLALAACGSTTSATSGGYGAQTTKAATATTTATTALSTNTTSSYGGGGGGYAVPPAPTTMAAGPANLTIIKTPLGQAIADASGYALYMYSPDGTGAPTCTDTCAANWPPAATTGAPTVSAGLDAKLLTTVKHPSGVTQVVYNGHPLYRYGAEAAPGDIGGEGRLGYWFLLTPAGDTIAG
jgi:predicted lipoprotein with Yx(FWY)xxD motif